MNSQVSQSAKRLLISFELPVGVVNVLPISDENGARLLVWIDPQYLKKVSNLPKTFEGYPVCIELRPLAVGF